MLTISRNQDSSSCCWPAADRRGVFGEFRLPSEPGIGHRQTQDLNIIDDVRDFETLNHNMAEHSIRPRVVRPDRFSY